MHSQTLENTLAETRIISKLTFVLRSTILLFFFLPLLLSNVSLITSLAEIALSNLNLDVHTRKFSNARKNVHFYARRQAI